VEPNQAGPVRQLEDLDVYERCVAAGTGTPQPGGDARAVSPGSPNPLLGLPWFVDPLETAYHRWQEAKDAGRADEASLLWRIAREPRFRWFGKFTRPDLSRQIRRYLTRVQCEAPGTIPQMAILRAEANECHRRYLGGGRAEDASTRAWYEEFARAIGSTRVVIAFEPDSLGTISCLARHRRRARLRLLRYGVDVLSQLPNATIYLEAAASDWERAGSIARKLRSIGIRKVRGFMLNVTHFDWTRSNIRYGLRVSRATGGKHFVINTSANGRGPLHIRRRGRRRLNRWCNPPNRGLGPRPTTLTSHPKVDAYLWIGRPGYSAGACNGGPTPPGAWWPERALELARNASERER
jgi:endoglucanase